MKDDKLEIDCKHGKGIASAICYHQLNSVDPIGFIENSSDPDDLQAWCYACEYLFQLERDMTEKFKKFSNAKIVCEKCYENFKSLHSI
ncbi:hypothetical protein WSM22_32970 [Cytophagales bacterium WSM2-2]|nr:hypothetical protein WSM22_32970 [Cytophagales bacterium WSM2-2]